MLNCVESWQVSQGTYDAAKTASGETPLHLLRLRLDPERVSILNDVLDRTGAVVVLSTSWRNWPDQDYVSDKMREAGFTGEVVGSTIGWMGPGKSRGDEIRRWLDDFGERVEAFAILDDSDDVGALTPYLVLTDPVDGLTEAHVPRLLELLTPPMGVRG